MKLTTAAKLKNYKIAMEALLASTNCSSFLEMEHSGWTVHQQGFGLKTLHANCRGSDVNYWWADERYMSKYIPGHEVGAYYTGPGWYFQRWNGDPTDKNSILETVRLDTGVVTKASKFDWL